MKLKRTIVASSITFLLMSSVAYAQFRIPNPSTCDDMACILGRLAGTARELAVLSFTGMFAYGTFLYITGRDNEDQIGKARTIMIGAVTGIVLIFAAPALTNFALSLFRTTFIRT